MVGAPRRGRPLRRGSAHAGDPGAPDPVLLRDARAHRGVEPGLLRHQRPAGADYPLRHDGHRRGLSQRPLRLGRSQGAARLRHRGGHGRRPHDAASEGPLGDPGALRRRQALPLRPRRLGPLQLGPARHVVRDPQRRSGGEHERRPPLPGGVLLPCRWRRGAPPGGRGRLHLRAPDAARRLLPDARPARLVRALRRRDQRGPHAPVHLRMAPRLREAGRGCGRDTLPLRLQPHPRHPRRPRRGTARGLRPPRRGLRRVRRRGVSELLLGVDIGTSSSKGVLSRPDGEVIATAQREHELSLPRPGWAEHDAEGVWWADFVSLCEELLGKADDHLAAVCTSGIGACLLPADEAGRPLRPAILYGIDTRAEKEIGELNERHGEETLLGRCGSVLTTQAVGPKLLWLRRNEPEVWEKTGKFFMANSFIAWRLTGEYVLDHHSASQCDPLYDVHASRWIEDRAEELAPGLQMPRLLWPAEVVGEVTAEASRETGIPAGTPVAAGTIDAWSEGASVGVQKPGDLMLMYGTTMFIIEVLEEALHHPGLWGTSGILPGTHNLAAGMATSGALTGWLQKISGGVPYAELTEEAAAVPAGSDALVVLPYFAGGRTPLFDPLARGVISCLTMSHTPGHVYRAMLEATAF